MSSRRYSTLVPALVIGLSVAISGGAAASEDAKGKLLSKCAEGGPAGQITSFVARFSGMDGGSVARWNIVVGTNGNDTFDNGDLSDSLPNLVCGRGGHDTFDDSLFEGSGFHGGSGNDTVKHMSGGGFIGGPGDDHVITGGPGGDIFFGGPGRDSVGTFLGIDCFDVEVGCPTSIPLIPAHWPCADGNPPCPPLGPPD